jgi:hypothetical protein
MRDRRKPKIFHPGAIIDFNVTPIPHSGNACAPTFSIGSEPAVADRHQAPMSGRSASAALVTTPGV